MDTREDSLAEGQDGQKQSMGERRSFHEIGGEALSPDREMAPYLRGI
jgi:hypothetical protein